MRRWAVAVAVVALGVSACGSEDGTATQTALDLDYGSPRVAPLPEDLVDRRVDEYPYPENQLVEMELDSGSVAAFWIDPDDIAQVFVQYSDPDDGAAWTAPALVYEAGDGCLYVVPDSSGTTVAVGLGCYQSDTFAQQAPDEGVSLVSTDFTTWEQQPSPGDSYPAPEVSEDGATVTFDSLVYDGQVDATWEQGKGFS